MTLPSPVTLALLSSLTAAAALPAGGDADSGAQIHDRQGREVVRYDRSHALLIGVGDYTAGWPDLKSVSRELAMVRDTLEAHGFEVEEAPADPTAEQLEAGIRGFFDAHGGSRHHRLLVFFSGHGYSFDGDDRGFLVPADAPDPRADRKEFLRRAISMRDVVAWSRQAESSHVLFVFDSCFSSRLFKPSSFPEIPRIAGATARPVRQFITAGRAGQTLPAKRLFTPFFTVALAGAGDLNGDGYVTGTELGQYVDQRLTAFSRGLRPQYGKIGGPDHGAGDFIFRLPERPGQLSRLPSRSALAGPSEQLRWRAQMEDSSEERWARWRAALRAEVAKANAFERREAPAELKAKVWQRLVERYGDNDPYSSEDEKLRGHARKRIAYWHQAVAVVDRYPTVEAPDEVRPGVEFAVQVSLTEELRTPEVTETKLQFTLPDQPEWTLGVAISLGPDFRIRDGGNYQEIQLPRHGPSTTALFLLTAGPLEDARKESRIHVTFFHEGAFLTRVTRPIAIVRPRRQRPIEVRVPRVGESPAGGSAGPRMLAPSSTVPVSGMPRPSPVGSPLELGRRGADLTLSITDSELQIWPPAGPPLFDRLTLPPELSRWLEEQYDALAAAGGRRRGRGVRISGRPRDPQALATGIGRDLWKNLVPGKLQHAFWELHERLGEDFDSIQIYSDNPLIPWELMRPHRVRDDGVAEELGFLGLEFNVARWHLVPRERLDPSPQAFPLEGLAIVRPNYEDRLPGAKREVARIKRLALAPVEEYRGTLAVMRQLSARFPAGILHFAGHGIATDNGGRSFQLLLEDGSVSLKEWQGWMALKSTAQPFVFFNACDAGKVRRVGFIEGWAPVLLDAGASGYLGALWPVDDRAAARFAERFYRLLAVEAGERGKASIARLVREARNLYGADPNPTYLAYVFYGDVHLDVVVDRGRQGGTD